MRPALRVSPIAVIGQHARSAEQFRHGEPRSARRDHPYPVMATVPLYLGVDGGGTKTALVLLDAEGTIRATHLAAGSYYLTIGVEGLGALLAEAVTAILAKAAVSSD